MPNLTQARLQELLQYDPDTGEFTRRRRPSNHIEPGQRAGWDHKDGYRCIKVDGSCYLAHRLVWLYVHGHWPADQLDHINGRRSDNRISNLRECTNAENQQNRKRGANNSSGYVGVRLSVYGTWLAFIRKDGKQRHLGTFSTKAEAIAARREAKAQLHRFAPIATSALNPTQPETSEQERRPLRAGK